MPKIVFIGAGSHVFSKATISDILSYPELRDCTISLMDIAQEPLDLITSFAKNLVKQNGFATKIESTTKRREALYGADYVFVTIAVGRRMGEQPDVEIPLKYGVDGPRDSVGTGGIFGGVRHVPVLLDICHDMEELCPDAWLLNYTNPMSINTWAVNDYTRIKAVGLCHSVQSTATQLLKYLGVPITPEDLPEGADDYYRSLHNRVYKELKDISYWVAGINHMAWFLEFKWRGQDAYPLLLERFENPAVYSGPEAHYAGADIVRVELLKAFGYFVTESSPHNGAYVPYFKKRPELIKKFKLEERVTQNRVGQDEKLKEQLGNGHIFPIIRSIEYGVTIIHSIETGIPSRINANVKNDGLITNLLEGSCVEVPCLVDKEGIHPCNIGNLPPQLAALNRNCINVHELAVRGIVEKDKTKLFHAMLVDPLTSTVLTIEEIRKMIDDLFLAEKMYLKGFR
jgi:alpha-galactosidase